MSICLSFFQETSLAWRLVSPQLSSSSFSSNNSSSNNSSFSNNSNNRNSSTNPNLSGGEERWSGSKCLTTKLLSKSNTEWCEYLPNQQWLRPIIALPVDSRFCGKWATNCKKISKYLLPLNYMASPFYKDYLNPHDFHWVKPKNII